MAAIELNFLGDLEVLRDGESMPLPPSKKTRALLAYLALGARPYRREHLCELLWEVPDDPRGSLRWSLSKLRRLVDDGERARIIADRSKVDLDVSDVAVDVVALRAMSDGGLEEASIGDLEAAVSRYRGNFLEGLELSNFHDFHAWCVAERDSALQAQIRLLRRLIDLLSADPDKALPHARALVTVDPYAEQARASLIELLVTLRKFDEAEQQELLGTRMLEEAGIASSGALQRARRSARAETAAATPVPVAPVQVYSAATDSMIGRDEEARRLAEALARVVEHDRSEFILLRGEPGIGKTRLMTCAVELAREAGALVVEASASESDSIRPFALWTDGLRDLDSSELPQLGRGEGLDHRDRLFDRVSEFIAKQCDSRPVVLIFDDLQWCDESSAAALHYVARTNRRRPLLGVLAARDDEIRDNRAIGQALRSLRHDAMLREIKLRPLSALDVKTLIEQRAPGADSARLSEECGGNPLLAVELARAESMGVAGSSLEELVRDRVARFDLEDAEILRWASVLAPRVEVEFLVRATGLDSARVGEILDAAAGAALLRTTDHGYRFSHDLVARSVYADISPARRRTMHRRVAELLEADTALELSHAAELAHHASQSGDPGLAARAMVSAGRLCLRFFANEDAAVLARKGLALVDHVADAERVRLTIELRDVMLAAAPVEDWRTAADEYVELAEQALDHGAPAHARLGYHMASYLRWLHGEWGDAREETLQAERVVRGGSEEDRVIGMAEAAKCLALLERDIPQADAMIMEAEGLAVRRRVRHHAIPAARGMLSFHRNEFDQAEESFKESRTLCKSAGDRLGEFLANEYLVMIALERGNFEVAEERCRVLVEIGDKVREGSEGPFSRALDGLFRYARDGDSSDLERSLEDLRSADAKHRLAYTQTRAALLDLDNDRPDSALLRAGEALACAEALERPTDTLLAHVALAQAHRARDDEENYSRHMDSVSAIDAHSVARWAADRAAALLAARDSKE